MLGAAGCWVLDGAPYITILLVVLEREKEGLKPNEVRVFVSCDQNGLVSVSSAEYMKKNKQPEPEPEPVVEKEETKTEKEESKKEGDDKNEVCFFTFFLLSLSLSNPSESLFVMMNSFYPFNPKR